MAIVSDKYRLELAELLADPILQEMAHELGSAIERGDTTRDAVAAGGWGLMRSVGDEYRRRGGRLAQSIGGPLLAVQVALGLKDQEKAFA